MSVDYRNPHFEAGDDTDPVCHGCGGPVEDTLTADQHGRHWCDACRDEDEHVEATPIVRCLWCARWVNVTPTTPTEARPYGVVGWCSEAHHEATVQRDKDEAARRASSRYYDGFPLD